MKTEGVGNKVVLIALLCAALALFLYIRPRLFAPDPPPTLLDRLPESEIVGRYNLLDIAKETNSLMFKNKVPFREYLTYDFLLSQAKGIGIDIQSTGYFFSNGKDEWGTFVSVLDSSKIQIGFNRLEQYIQVSDTVIYNRKVKKINDLGLYIFYDKDYMLVYKGSKVRHRIGKAIFAREGDIENSWEKFLKKNTFQDEKIVLYSNSPRLKKFGFDYVMFAHDSDSVNVKLKTYLHSDKNLKIKEKEAGIAFERNQISTKALEIHLDISEFKKDKNNPLYQWIASLGKKVSFPTAVFFDAWEGDLCFQEGGTQFIDEEIVEMGYDEEFNRVEVRKVNKVTIPAYSLMFSVNKNGKKLISALFAKGIITKQGKYYHFLFSPPLNLNILPESISAYTSGRPPKVSNGNTCNGLWKYKGTDVFFHIDSLKKKEVYGSLEFEIASLIKKGKIKR
ncbi:hypothetical protein [Fluviicola sp.]|jgi:hypothetical protein|uniref:hypothetical protein n=1 Tax=Fluviicola sp. TaxID=1917219 RepID=UPI0028228BEF|nr:hypothetical protein [Fluviicola sp.]MDR0801432.1 hypothetical protein [Fluviicola sp.]